MTIPARSRRAAVFAILIGLVTGWGIHAHPERLKVPAWVAYSACLAFVVAGLVIFLREAPDSARYRWSVVALAATMGVPPAWVAFGPGARACTLGFAELEVLHEGLGCRLGFGVAALVMFVVMLWVLRWVLRAGNYASKAN